MFSLRVERLELLPSGSDGMTVEKSSKKSDMVESFHQKKFKRIEIMIKNRKKINSVFSEAETLCAQISKHIYRCVPV